LHFIPKKVTFVKNKLQPKKKIIIIGAGLAGMSTGCYLQMNGFETEIFEMHKQSGGLCTSWKRSDYLIDGCIHFMTGTSSGESTFRFWNDLIDMGKVDFVYQETHSVAEDETGNRIYFYSNVQQLENELLEKAPEDRKMILLLTKGIKKLLNIKLPVGKPPELMNMKDGITAGFQMIPYLRSLIKYVKISNGEFSAKLKNPLLKTAFEQAFIKEQPLLYTIMPFVWRHRKEMGYPKGGSVFIASQIEKRYKDLGGKINFNSKVGKITTENNRVTGIVLENGTKINADIVISAADGRSTIYNLLDGKYKDNKTTERYESDIFETIDKTFYIALGINKDFAAVPHKLYFPLKKSIHVDSLTDLTHIEITHYCDDQNAAPAGKSLITMMPDAKDWEYWYDLRKADKAKYDSEKQRIASEIIEALDERFGEIKKNVEMIDIATPASYIRYTGNWTGGQISWKATRKIFGKPTAWQIKNFTDFYMVGQWAAASGGLNNVVMMGNHLTQIICKKENVKFQSFSAQRL
jgi:phytoene dehydrogenase-like protein